MSRILTIDVAVVDISWSAMTPNWTLTDAPGDMQIVEINKWSMWRGVVVQKPVSKEELIAMFVQLRLMVPEVGTVTMYVRSLTASAELTSRLRELKGQLNLEISFPPETSAWNAQREIRL
jgi:hypothetical protein